MSLARLSDPTFGTCTGHKNSISTGGMVLGRSPNVFANGLPAARLGDIVISYCGHIGTIVTGSSKIFVNGIPAARLGDSFIGTYSGTIIGGSSNVIVGG